MEKFVKQGKYLFKKMTDYGIITINSIWDGRKDRRTFFCVVVLVNVLFLINVRRKILHQPLGSAVRVARKEVSNS